jgi:hypothetical protein
MNLTDIAIENDIYLAGWIRTLKPVIDIDTTYERFLKTNSWILPLTEDERRGNMRYLTVQTQRVSKNSIFLDCMEWVFKLILLPKTLRNYKKIGEPW